MNRRGFLKLVGVAALAPALPVLATPKSTVVGQLGTFEGVRWISEKPYAGFDPRQQYGHGLIAKRKTFEMWQLLRANMERTVPPAYRKKVTWHEKPVDLGTRIGIAWIYNPKVPA